MWRPQLQANHACRQATCSWRSTRALSLSDVSQAEPKRRKTVMKYTFAFEPEPFGGYSELDVYESFDTESEGIWQGEVSRGSPDYVRWVQQSLNQILGLRLAVDGIIGRQTHSAIRSFQQRQGLRVDGVVGAQTERALRAQSASPSSGTVAPPPQTSAVPSGCTSSYPPQQSRKDAARIHALCGHPTEYTSW